MNLLFIALLLLPTEDKIFSSLVEILKVEEGFRSKPYLDSRGVLTIGYGTNIHDGISEVEADYLLKWRLRRAAAKLTVLWPSYREQPRSVQIALLDMSYQLGVYGLLRFHQTLARLESKDYSGAADSALDSLWAKQTPKRAARVAETFRAVQPVNR